MHVRMPMAPTLSELHYTCLFIEGSALADSERLHDELAFKLASPKRMTDLCHWGPKLSRPR